jgi:hypothetical protein
MDRKQADEIHRHLVSANRSLGLAHSASIELGDDEVKTFVAPLGAMLVALQRDVLPAIYRQFPDLKPPLSKEKPRIDSKLTWDQVRLPPSVTVLDFDRAILSTLSPQWRKTARIVGRVSEQYIKLGIDMDPAIVAARLMAMVDSDLVEGAGDLRMWRFSEVRLKD